MAEPFGMFEPPPAALPVGLMGGMPPEVGDIQGLVFGFGLGLGGMAGMSSTPGDLRSLGMGLPWGLGGFGGPGEAVDVQVLYIPTWRPRRSR